MKICTDVNGPELAEQGQQLCTTSDKLLVQLKDLEFLTRGLTATGSEYGMFWPAECIRDAIERCIASGIRMPPHVWDEFVVRAGVILRSCAVTPPELLKHIEMKTIAWECVDKEHDRRPNLQKNEIIKALRVLGDGSFPAEAIPDFMRGCGQFAFVECTVFRSFLIDAMLIMNAFTQKTLAASEAY